MFAQWFRLLLCYLFGVLESLKHGEVRFFFVLFCYCQSPVVRTNSKQWAVASLTNIKKGPFRCCMPPPVAIYALMRRPKTELYHEFGKQTRNESEWSRRQNTYKHDIHRDTHQTCWIWPIRHWSRSNHLKRAHTEHTHTYRHRISTNSCRNNLRNTTKISNPEQWK